MATIVCYRHGLFLFSRHWGKACRAHKIPFSILKAIEIELNSAQREKKHCDESKRKIEKSALYARVYYLLSFLENSISFAESFFHKNLINYVSRRTCLKITPNMAIFLFSNFWPLLTRVVGLSMKASAILWGCAEGSGIYIYRFEFGDKSSRGIYIGIWKI